LLWPRNCPTLSLLHSHYLRKNIAFSRRLTPVSPSFTVLSARTQDPRELLPSPVPEELLPASIPVRPLTPTLGKSLGVNCNLSLHKRKSCRADVGQQTTCLGGITRPSNYTRAETDLSSAAYFATGVGGVEWLSGKSCAEGLHHAVLHT